MPRKNTFITVTDQFCGAGGSSQGARAAGAEVRLAMNHWRLAVDTHNTNFPEADHDCADISASDPRRYSSTDILITSPECTNHTLAKGVKIQKKQLDLFDKGILDPAAERSRATMWDVPRFAEYHSYNIIIVENVVDAHNWVMFDSWLHAMRSLGYEHELVFRNSMHFWPTPQSRDRMYVVFWKKGNKKPDLDYRPLAWCHKCEKDVESVQSWKDPRKRYGKYRQQYLYCCPQCSSVVEPYYYAAFNFIDWSDIGIRIGDRPKPLSANTIKRIEYGLKKYGSQPMQVINYSPGYTKPATEAFGSVTCQDHHGILNQALIVNNQHSTGIGFRVRSAGEQLPTVATTHQLNLVTPFVVKAEHTSQMNVRGVDSSFQTQTTRQSMGLIVPWIIEMNRTGEAKPAGYPTATLTAGGINHALLVENKGQSKSRPVTDPCSTLTTKPHLGIVTMEAWRSFLTAYNNGSFCTKNITEEIGSVTTRDRHNLITYQQPNIEDCFYRMLKPHEIKMAMAFEPDYVILGSGRDQVKQCGNAVTPPVMKWLIQQCVNSLN